MRSVCVFCGSNPGRRPEYLAGAADLGRILAARGIRVIYGGAHIGLMGALADAVLAAGGEIVGVIPGLLVDAEVAHPGLSELRITGAAERFVRPDHRDLILSRPSAAELLAAMDDWSAPPRTPASGSTPTARTSSRTKPSRAEGGVSTTEMRLGIAIRLVVTEKAANKHLSNISPGSGLYPSDDGTAGVLAVLSYLNA